MFNHLFWSYRALPHGCRLESLQGFEKVWKLHNGESQRDTFPRASFSMNPDLPHDTLLHDHLINTSALVVVSGALKEFLEGQRLPGVEYLRVSITDHKSRVVREPYFIVHPLLIVDVIDVEKSGVEFSRIKKTAIDQMERFVLFDELVEEIPPLFRARGLTRHLLIERALAEMIDAAGFTGNGWVDPARLAGARIPARLGALVER